MPRSSCLPVLALFFLFIISTGCMSLAIGNVIYSSRGLSVHVTNAGNPVNAGVQVRIYVVKNLVQHELTVTGTSLTVQKGENDLVIPVNLAPGNYKIYVYLTVNGERQTATIRDIVV